MIGRTLVARSMLSWGSTRMKKESRVKAEEAVERVLAKHPPDVVRRIISEATGVEVKDVGAFTDEQLEHVLGLARMYSRLRG